MKRKSSTDLRQCFGLCLAENASSQRQIRHIVENAVQPSRHKVWLWHRKNKFGSGAPSKRKKKEKKERKKLRKVGAKIDLFFQMGRVVAEWLMWTTEEDGSIRNM